MTDSTTVFKDKLRGGYLGVCLGDALGIPHEKSSGPEYTGRLQYIFEVRSHFGYPTRYGPIGQVGDDSTMTTALLWQIITHQDWKEDEVIEEYLRWANELKFTVGKNTRDLFVGVTTVRGYRKRFLKSELGNVQSNGSLMRAFPFILLSHNPTHMYEVAVKDTSLTNPSPVNQEAVLIYLLMLQYAYSNTSSEVGLPYVISQSRVPWIREALTQAQGQHMRRIDGDQKGWVVHPIYLVARAWIMTDNPNVRFSDVIDWVIMRGGDTDTNASIVGSFVGMRLGETRMKSEQVTARNIEILLGSNPTRGQLPYDFRYHPSTGLSLLG